MEEFLRAIALYPWVSFWLAIWILVLATVITDNLGKKK